MASIVNPETGHEGLGYFDVCLGGCLFCRSNYSLFFLGAVMITISFVNSTANIANAGLLGAVVVVAVSWGAIWLLLKSVGLLVGFLGGGDAKIRECNQYNNVINRIADSEAARGASNFRVHAINEDWRNTNRFYGDNMSRSVFRAYNIHGRNMSASLNLRDSALARESSNYRE